MDSLLTAGDVAKILKISKVQVYKMAQNGVLPCYRLKTHGSPKKCSVRFRIDDIEHFIKRCRVDHQAQNHEQDHYSSGN